MVVSEEYRKFLRQEEFRKQQAMEEQFQQIDSLYIGKPLSCEIVKNQWRECYEASKETGLLVSIPEYTDEEHDIMLQESRQSFILKHGYDLQALSTRVGNQVVDTVDFIFDNIGMLLFFIVVFVIAAHISFSIFTNWFGG